MSQKHIARLKKEILNYGGLPPYDVAAMMKHLSFSLEDLDNWRKWKRHIALPMDDGTILYPYWQFDSRGSLVYGLEEFLRAAPEDPWGVADILTSPQKVFDGKTPIDMLQKGRSSEVIRKTVDIIRRAYE